MKRINSGLLGASLPCIFFGLVGTASAIFIDNGVPAGTLGHWRVDVENAGESHLANLTAQRFASTDIVTEDVLFEYLTYVDIGGGGVRLSSSTTSPAVLTGPNQISSSGSFLGSGGNTINWTAVSTIGIGDSRMINRFSFVSANGSPLGNIRLYQYMDEDIETPDDDVFLTRGSIAGQDLELFTVDNAEVYGVSHGGALIGAQGLTNASFAGWAADEYDDMAPAIEAGVQSVTTSGVIDTTSLPPFVHPEVGSAYGPADIVSVLAWDVDPAQNAAAIVTTLGGVPDIQQLQEPVIDNAFINATAGIGEVVMHTFTATDPDGLASNLTWSNFTFDGPVPAIPPAFNPSTQLFEWDTTGSPAGVYVATVKATDPSGLSDEGMLTISLAPIPEPAAVMMFLSGAALFCTMAPRRLRTSG
jgi:hypothetical protein